MDIHLKKGDADMQVVIFTLHDEIFGIDISNIESIIKPQDITIVPNAKHFVEGVINLRGKIIVVIDLNTRLGLPRRESTQEARIVVLKIDEEQIGIRVDAVSETVMINRSDIQPAPPIVTQKFEEDVLRGICALGDQLLTLLDMNKLFTISKV